MAKKRSGFRPRFRLNARIAKALMSIEADRQVVAVLPLTGRAAALEILVEARVWDAKEALEKGLLTRVVPDARLEQETYASARRIAEGAPLVNRWHKQFVRRLAPRPEPLAAAEIEENFAYFATEDYREGMEAFAKKRKPQFKGR